MSDRVLFVDDDPKILAAFQRQLRKKVTIETVESGAEGLEALRRNGPFSVVVTDYCMPSMNGIEFLGRARKIAPETVRMLLTGSADLGAAIQAVNQGNIFRFLTKPCSPDNLLEAVQTGIYEYRRTHKERKFNKRSRRWLAQAMEVQQNLLPRGGSVWDGLDIAGKSLFCDQTGGDYYDYFEKPGSASRAVSIVAGDVSDHGLPSALLMTTARAFLRECTSRPGSVSTVVEQVNRQLTHDVQSSGRFMTLFYAELDRQDRSIRWARAGHDPALVYDPRSGDFDELGGQGGLPLGVFGEARYEEYHRELSTGQLLVIGTDGIWEARNGEGRMFGKLLLQQMIRANAVRPAAEIVEKVLEALKQFLFPLDLQDDATLVVVKVED
ncbi:MAG TPA: SpoIIE family protein phosphatase [Desulfobacterales bacterium]|nr:SpoIIE family protein phosphatase [Desulfobacterales bacterium]